MKKKILYILENKNIFLLEQIKQLSKFHEVNILTTSKKVQIELEKKYKVIFQKKTKIEKFIEKISIILSSPNFSSKEKFYNDLEIFRTNSFLRKMYLYFKKFLFIKSDYLKSFNLFNFFLPVLFFRDKYRFLNDFDTLIYDFRFYKSYNNLKSLILAANKIKKIKKICYIYSWDNIFTGNVITQADYYLVWSEFIKENLKKIHNIEEKKLVTVKPIQFFYLHKQVEEEEFVLYPCSFSGDDKEQDSLVYHDVYMIKTLSKILNKLDSKIKLLVRPYPSSKYDESVNIFKELNNVKFNYQTSKDQNNKDHFSYKNNQINKSICVISFGTTFNLEAIYNGKISLLLDFSNFKPKKNHHYLYDNYSKKVDEFVFFKKIAIKNYIFDEIQLENTLLDIMKNKDKREIYLNNSLEINKKLINFKYGNLNDFLNKVIY
tara:strand:+ start:1969 stop:3264 length:1296 start_codon:yes stop_codon:yes gene_type:complete